MQAREPSAVWSPGVNIMLRFMTRLLRSRRAATAVEYGLILSLIFIAMLAGVRAVSGATIQLWGNVANTIESAR